MSLYYHCADVMSIVTSIFYEILDNCKEMKSNYKNKEITKEVLESELSRQYEKIVFPLNKIM